MPWVGGEMTRAQYFALCLIGGIAFAAWMNTRTLAAYLTRTASPGLMPKPLKGVI